ncbi:NYN domain-containing protein [Candidatus Pacearchaeota archaeon]|nr:NYN domain-containing protein [Candidatus Pacearchaeota archaeon]
MAEKKRERVAIFIDGSNLYHSLKRFNTPKINFKKLINILSGERLLVSVFYYNAPLDITLNPEKYWKQQKFFNQLREIPKFNVVLSKLRKYMKNKEVIAYEVKGDDVHLAVDIVSGAYENLYDVAIIVSGDEDFVPAIDKIKQLNKKVENAYFIGSSSAALKNISDSSICVNKIIKEIL